MLAGDTHAQLIHVAKTLSSGTMSTLTRLKRYDQLDEIQLQFVRFCERHAEFVNWMGAWNEFAEQYDNRWDDNFPPCLSMCDWSIYLYYARERERHGQRHQVIQAKRLIRHYIHQNYMDYRRRGKGNRAWRRLRQELQPIFLPLVSLGRGGV